ncbi:HAD family hydrolase [Lichenibacterium ramalinae]|uniref:phosphoglycolate phosphatase n=1 Tax=Lichenibacterium ramalinae TaxID=2316527 RepID=A0A4Q2RLI4_9HYPH|nr:HAD-IA family hydrolase [Lichenibacterium ramalinae]RYB07711.1 HAD family hydrolase [Lichenibacterium ramalinae]
MHVPPAPLAALLFDKDGTLVDFDLTWGRAGHAVMLALGGGDAAAVARLAEAMHYDVAALRFAPSSPLIAGAPDTYVHLWAEALGRSDDAVLLDEMNAAFTDATLRALAPIGTPEAVLLALKGRGLKLGLATNDGEASARRQLAALGLDAHMDFIAGYDTGHGGKPDPGMVLAFAAATGVAPGRIGMVGDSHLDLVSARAAGAVAIAVLTGPARRDELAPLADHVIDGIADLPALVDRLSGTA